MREKDKTVKSVKKEILKRLAVLIAAGVFVVFFSGISFGWFAFNKRTTSQPAQIGISMDGYDIVINRTTEFDAGYNYIAGTGEAKDLIAADGYSISATDTADEAKIAFEMVNEFVYDGHRYLMPGAYGTVTFYLRPAAGTSGVYASFELSFGAYVLIYEDEDPVMVEVDSERILNMMKGHILFFTDRTGVGYENYKYSGLIDDGTFDFDSAGKATCGELGKEDCYKVTLYWEWAVTYADIVENTSDSEPQNKKFPEELTDYMNDNADYFFADTSDLTDYDKLADSYNDGDQLIGSGADCLVLYIKAS